MKKSYYERLTLGEDHGLDEVNKIKQIKELSEDDKYKIIEDKVYEEFKEIYELHTKNP